jgi:ubiquinone/menaquinone biosynthesis C-methylase UbiE
VNNSKKPRCATACEKGPGSFVSGIGTSIDKREMMQRFDDQAPCYGSPAHLKTVGERAQIDLERDAILDAISRLQFTRALDIGCGPGIYLGDVSKLGNTVGLDFSLDMAMVAKKSVYSADVVRSDMESLPFQDNSFDLIYSVRVMKYLEGQSKFVLEVQRVCKEGGCVLLYDIRHLGVAYLALKVIRRIIPPRYRPHPRQLERLMPFHICALLSRSGQFLVKSRGVLFVPWTMYRYVTSRKILSLLAFLDRLLAKAPFSQYLAYSVLYTASRK